MMMIQLIVGLAFAACVNCLPGLLPWRLGGILHKPKTVSYPVWGGIEAITWVLAKGSAGPKSIDVDVHVSKPAPGEKFGTVVAFHWLRDWLLNGRVPTGKPGDYLLSVLTAMRPRRGGPWRIAPVAKLMARAGGRVVLCLEAKPDPQLREVEVWRKVRADAAKHGCRVLVMTIQRHGSTAAARQRWEEQAILMLKAAKAAGLPVMVLARGPLLPGRWGFVDAYKINRRVNRSWGKDMPSTATWVGPGSGVGASVIAPVATPILRPPAPTKIEPLKVPYIAARWHGGPQVPKAIVVHGTVTPCAPGWARNVANDFATTNTKKSAHYTADPAELIQSVWDHTVAYHCGYNTNTIAFELCDPQPRYDVARWDDAPHTAMLKLAAKGIAQTCLAYGIEIRRPSITELKDKGPHGIYGHDDSRRAFGHTTHTDPRGLPWDKFIDMIRAEADALRKGITT